MKMLKILNGGIQSLIVDWVGRLGYLDLGISRSGAMDHFAARAANLIVGNNLNEALIEVICTGFSIQFEKETVISITGANVTPNLNGKPIPLWKAIRVKKYDILTIGNMKNDTLGFRQYIAIADSIDVPVYLGSKSTAVYGSFGGYKGRCLRKGDEVNLKNSNRDFDNIEGRHFKTNLIPEYSRKWLMRAIPGPNAAPDYFTEKGMELFFKTEFKTQVFSDRSGIRLSSTKLIWTEERTLGEGHPSNITDQGYPGPGCLNISGDTPILFPRECPSSGGYVCPLSVIYTDQWMFGQIIPGRDIVQFIYCTPEEAIKIRKEQNEVFQESSILYSYDFRKGEKNLD